jgi:predicted metal-dependent enzyme (double-stranded beta helix superfamily)
MKKVLEKLQKLDKEKIEPNILKITLNTIDFSHVDYMSFLEGKSFDEYSRVYLMDSPLRVFLNIWPAQYQLPVHQHNNFWGYIAVLKGLLTETSFVYEDEEKQLSCHPPKNFRKGEVIFEPLNGIHHIQNPSPSKPLVTAHFYYPSIMDYNGVRIFDIKKKRMAVLNEKADRVSWEHPKDYYSQDEKKAFTVVNLW